jgi:hypothetical protein
MVGRSTWQASDMSDDLVLRLSDLRTALDSVLSAAAARLGDEVALPSDYYWHVPVDAAFDMGRKPMELTVGSLKDDLEELGSEKPDHVALWHDVGHLVGLLRGVEKIARP